MVGLLIVALGLGSYGDTLSVFRSDLCVLSTLTKCVRFKAQSLCGVLPVK